MSEITTIDQMAAAVATAAAETLAALPASGDAHFGAPPPPVDICQLTPQMVDECYHLDQLGDARLLIELFRGRYLRDNSAGVSEHAKFKAIYRWTGAHWEQDTAQQFLIDFMDALGAVFELRAHNFLDELAEKLKLRTHSDVRYELSKVKTIDMPDEHAHLKKADKYLARAKACRARQRALATADLAFSGENSLGFMGEWNAHRSWLPCRNGTINLANGLLMEPRPEHYFNCALEWDFRGLDEPCPVWEDAVSKIFFLNNIIEYVGYFCGAAATGYQTKDFFIFFGPRANNGKSLFFGVLAKLLGPFCESVGVDLLLRQTHRSASAAHPEMLRLQHARLAIFQEADSLDTFDSGKIKEMTSGGDEISMRTLHSDTYHTFSQGFTIALHTNKVPRLHGADRGLSQRVKIIPCDSEFLAPGCGVEPDTGERRFAALDRVELNKKLEAEMSGILAWIVRWAMKFLANLRRLPPAPPAVAEESAEFMLEGDLVSQYLAEICEIDDGVTVTSRELYQYFKIWCEDARNLLSKHILSETAFGREMKSHAKKKRTNSGVIYLGLQINLSKMPGRGSENNSNDLF